MGHRLRIVQPWCLVLPTPQILIQLKFNRIWSLFFVFVFLSPQSYSNAQSGLRTTGPDWFESKECKEKRWHIRPLTKPTKAFFKGSYHRTLVYTSDCFWKNSVFVECLNHLKVLLASAQVPGWYLLWSLAQVFWYGGQQILPWDIWHWIFSCTF